MSGQQAVRRFPASGQTIQSVFDSAGQRIAEYDQATGALIRAYVWLGDMPVAVVEGGQVYSVRVDHIGRPSFATTSAGTVVWSASYLPFGGVNVTTGAPIDLRFPGQWFQAEAGLYQNWMRDYDPTLGRYIEADPLGLVDGASVYGYVSGNPGRWVDPRGENTAVLTPLLCTGPQAAGCAVALVCGGIVAAIIYNSSGEDISDCGDGECPNAEAENETSEPPFPYPEGWDGTTPPAPGYEWRGKGEPGSGEGNWYDPETGTSVRPDLNHPEPIGPHVDVHDGTGGRYRWYPDGQMAPKLPR